MINNTNKILLCDDDKNLCQLISTYLTNNGLDIAVVNTFNDAMTYLNGKNMTNLMVLDVMLPDQNGLDGLKEIRKNSQLPVIILSGKGEPIDRILGLEFGADDYISKPCDPRELLARIKAILRRPVGKNNNGLIELQNLKINTSNREVRVNNKIVSLTGAEFNVLLELASNAGEVVKKEALVEHALGRKMMRFERAVDMHVSNLRQKLGGYVTIIGIRNHGYQLKTDTLLES